jgi:Protein of unknown function (DUF3298).
MENRLYEQALPFFNKGEYEEVLKIFRHATVTLSDKEKKILRESKKQITEQYLFLIKDCIQQKEYVKAGELQEEYKAKYDFDERVADIPIIIDKGTSIEKETTTEQKDILFPHQTLIVKDHAILRKEIIILFLFFCIIAGVWIYYSMKDDANMSPPKEAIPELNSSSTSSANKNRVSTKNIARNSSNQFKYFKEKRGDFQIDIEWPLSLIGVNDINKVQRAIIKRVFQEDSNNIQACIEKHFKEMQEAPSLGPYGTEGELTIKFQQRLNDLYIFKVYMYFDGGGGTGASVFRGESYIYFDNNIGNILNINNIIADYAKTLIIVNKHISLDEYAHKAEELPDNFILSASGITFIFPKYSIGYGYQGEVEIALTYDELNDILSETFKRSIGR